MADEDAADGGAAGGAGGVGAAENLDGILVAAGAAVGGCVVGFVIID